jgi:hypothetical protein
MYLTRRQSVPALVVLEMDELHMRKYAEGSGFVRADVFAPLGYQSSCQCVRV